MTTQEFSNMFDTLLNSYSNKPEFGESSSRMNIVLDEYEKSLYLTEAQEDIIRELYSGRNITGESFENTEELRRNLDRLIETAVLETPVSKIGHIKEGSVFYSLHDLKAWFITYESVKLCDEKLGCKNNTSVIVMPVTLDSYDKIDKNPFRQANDRRVLRLDAGNDIVELISKYKIKSYLLRYLKRPTPIILIDLPNELSINGVREKTECSLNPMIHSMILNRAVKLALQSKTIENR